MKSKESNKIVLSNISIFGEVLENIDTKEIELIIDKLNKNLRLDGLMEDDEILYENEDKDSSAYRGTINTTLTKRAKFPCYDGSFSNDIHKFLNSEQNRDLNKLYDIIIREIQKVYLGYTHVESKLYGSINQFIRFNDDKTTTPMQIVSKLKEIEGTLLDTIKFIESYLYQNFIILSKIFKKIDNKLSSKYEVESISLFFLLNIFELPNNELSYMLMFKIIDEVSCVLKYITEQLDEKITSKKPKNTDDNINDCNTDNEACLLDEKSNLNNKTYIAISNMRDSFISKISKLLNDIDSYSFYRAKFYNRYLYTKGNYEVDTNLFLYKIIEDNDENNIEEFLPINSLMDEEVIINKFISKSLVNKFLKFFKSQLPSSFKNNEKLIYLHLIQYNIISIFVIYWYKMYHYGFIDISIFYAGRITSKMFFNKLIKKRMKTKTLLIVSNLILILSLFMNLIEIGQKYYKFIFFCSRFLMGLSFSKNIDTKFIINYVPKLLVKKEIKKYYSINYLSLCLGFFLISTFNYIFSSALQKEENFAKDLIYKEVDANNIGEIFCGVISIIILIINIIFYKEIKYNDIMKVNSINDNKKGGLNGSFENIKRTSLNAISDSEKKTSPIGNKKLDDKKETTSIFSYGKAKMISFREKNKAKKLEDSLKDLDKKNYEGANQIFKILNIIMNNEIFSGKSYTNSGTKGFIFFYTTLYMISTIIIFYNPIFNMIYKENNSNNDFINEINSKDKIWIFGFAYLLAFIVYRFKLLQLSKDIYIWNITILTFMIFEICLNLIFIIFDNSYFRNSPIFYDNYYLHSFLSLILFFNILIQLCCLKVMIREIPIEKQFCSINIDNFMDIYESLVKLATFIGLFFLIKFSLITKAIYIKYLIEILYIIGTVIFIMFIFKRKQIALTKIINKITYETL